MDHDETMLAAIGYGAINVLLAMIAESCKELLAAFAAKGTVDTQPYVATLCALPIALDSVAPAPAWMDARTQFLTVVVCYRDLIDCLLLGDAARVSEASAAFHEAMTMSRIALERLAWRLGLPND